MRRLKKASLVAACLVMGASSLQAGTIAKVNLNGQKVFMQESPNTKNGTTYVHVDSMEKALGVEISNAVKSMPIREVANKVGATLEFDKATNTIGLNYKLNGVTDQWGRLTRTTNLPSNKALYPYFINSVPNEMYQKKSEFEKGGWLIEPVEGKHYIKPVNMSKYLDYFTKENIDSWMKCLDKNLDLRLNVSYKTVNNEWMEQLASTYPTSHKESKLEEIKEFISYMKKNKLEVVGDYYIEPSTFHVTNGQKFVRCYVKFKISSPKAKKVHLFQQYEYDINANTWYEGYVNLGLSTNVYSKYNKELWCDWDSLTYDVEEVR